MGLLDYLANDPTAQFGVGLLGAKGNFGQGIAAGFDAMRQGQQNAMTRDMYGMKIDEMRQQQAQQQSHIQALKVLREKLPEEMKPMFDVDPVGFLKQLQKQEEEYTLTPGSARFKGNNKLAEVPISPKEPPPLLQEIQAWSTMPDGPQKQMLGKILEGKAKQGATVQPFFQFLPTADGYAVGNARSGQIAPATINGMPVIKASDDPTLQGRIAGAKESAKTMAEETTKAALDAPRIIDNATTALKYSDELLKHPGFSQAVGKSSMLGIQKIPGTEGKDFMNRLDQLKGGAFLEAFNTLKGGGQITEIEGKKATDAIARMDNATSEEEFKSAVKDYQDVIRKGMNRAKMKAKPIAPVQQPQQGGVKFLGFE